MWHLFDGSSYTPHGFCLAWQPGLIWLTAISNLVTAFSYFSIPAAIVFLMIRRPDLGYRPVAVLFAAFILACGTTHIFDALDLWLPIYRLAGITDAITAILSVATAILLWPLLPKVIALPSPTSLQKSNTMLLDAEFATSQANRWLVMGEQIAHAGHWRQASGDRHLTCSLEFRRIFGFDAGSDIIPEDAIQEKLHPEDRARIRRAVLEAIRTQAPFEALCRLVHASGEIRYLEVRGEAQPGPDGKAASIFGVCIDRTEQAKVELELEQARSSAEAARELIERIALQDGLTGLANRRQFDKTLDMEARRCRRDGGHLALVMIDVDQFKAFNDTYGHLAGDNCLRAVSSAISAPLLRPGDLVARYGGEEFAAILPGADLTAATDLAWKIVRAIRALALTHESSASGIVTISAGVAAVTSAGETISTEQLIDRADNALYTAKNLGRDQVFSAPYQEAPDTADISTLAATE